MGWGGILGFEHGVVLAPMGPDVASPNLVAAVANAGGIGLLSAPAPTDSYEKTIQLIRETKKLTDRPFGAGIILQFANSGNTQAIFDEKLAVLQVFWGDYPKELVEEAHRHGVKVMHQAIHRAAEVVVILFFACDRKVHGFADHSCGVLQVGSLAAAEKAVAAGVDAIIVQGFEAGGHVIGKVGLMALLPRVVDLVGEREIAIIAAGSITDARGYVAALTLGAHGVCLGTRFVATDEANVHDLYKEKLVEYSEEQTAYTDVFGRSIWPNAPHRVLNTPLCETWKNAPDSEVDKDQPVIGHTTIHWEETDLHRLGGLVPNACARGEIESMVMYGGQGVGLISHTVPAAKVVKDLVEGAQRIISSLSAKLPGHFREQNMSP